MRAISVVALCIVSAAVGAGIDHYWNDLSSLAGLDWAKRASSPRSNASETKPTTADPWAAGRGEVLGDRVQCDVRYQELKLPESEYRASLHGVYGSTQ
jgi:hypothetical protein